MFKFKVIRLNFMQNVPMYKNLTKNINMNQHKKDVLKVNTLFIFWIS